MAISMNLLLFVVGAGIVQSIFLASLIYFHPKSDRSVNSFLALFIVSLTIPMLVPILQYYYSWQVLLFLDPFLLLTAPLLYLYVRSFKETLNWKKVWPHFILFLIFVAFDYHLFVDIASKYPPSQQVPPEMIYNPSSILRVVVRISQMITYYLLASRVLTSYQRSIMHLFSETSNIDLNWVRWLINGYLILVLAMVVFYVAILKNPEQFSLMVLLNTAVVTPFIYAVTFKGVTQPTLWQVQKGISKETVLQEIHDAEESELAPPEGEGRNIKDTLGPERRALILDRIISLMETDKLYLRPELTLQDLADKLEVPYYQVSVSINEGLHKTFYDLVNGYRVEEAKRLLMDPKNRSNKILAVAFDAGFNSKTTFNTVFKKLTGITPTEYKEQQQPMLEV